MKPHTLPVKRRPAPKGILKRLSAVTGNRKQRVAATAADMEAEDSSSKISRALTIIFLIHIVAIALIFVHRKFLDGKMPAVVSSAEAEPGESSPSVAAKPRRTDAPRLSGGDVPYVVRAGDNYGRIAATAGVDEQDLRLINEHAEITPGLILKIPPKREVAPETAEIAVSRPQSNAAPDDGLVEAVDVSNAPRAQLVRPNVHSADETKPSAVSASSGKTYEVQSGDSVWRIANRFKVSQEALMKKNGISDARKMKVGMKLVIP